MTRPPSWLLFALLLSATPAGAQVPSAAEPAQERVLFHTVAGDLVFVLYPNAAPQTVKQFLTLVRAGVYDATAFSRLRPGFIAQIGSASDRKLPLTTAQSALIHRLPVEASPLKHERGVLSMARKPNDPESAETSFCVMLGPAPQLDGQYTIFGRLESGDDVLEQLLKVPRNAQNRPTVRLDVTRAEVVDSPQALANRKIIHARPIPGLPPVSPATAVLRGAAVPQSASPPSSEPAVTVGILLMVLLGVASALLRGRISPRHSTSLDLVGVLIGTFLLLMVLMPEGQHHASVAVALFFGLISVFKLLGRFEAAEK